jgi:hypothetical protein
MPTVARLGGLRVVVYPNDHRPAHVHVMGAGKEAVFVLNCPQGPPTIRGYAGFSGTELRGILSELTSLLATLCKRWSNVHGAF